MRFYQYQTCFIIVLRHIAINYVDYRGDSFLTSLNKLKWIDYTKTNARINVVKTIFDAKDSSNEEM